MNRPVTIYSFNLINVQMSKAEMVVVVFVSLRFQSKPLQVLVSVIMVGAKGG